MICLSCEKGKAINKPPFGWLPCQNCQNRQKKYKVKPAIEMTTNAIKEDRQRYKQDILQRYQGDTPNLDYIKKYGPSGFTLEEVKRARHVYTENEFYVDKSEKVEKLI